LGDLNNSNKKQGVIMKKNVLFLIILPLLLLNGCPESSPSRRVHFFGWKPDGSSIIAVVNDHGKPDYAQELFVFDLSGREQKKFILSKRIESIYFSDKLRFAQDGKSFFAQIGNDIYLVNTDDGKQTLLISDREYLSVSPSGKTLLAGQIRLATPRDSHEYSIFRINGTSVQQISSKMFPSTAFFAPYAETLRVVFISDSLFACCYSPDNQLCALTFFDTNFSINYSMSESRGPFELTFAERSKELAYIADSSFWLYNITTRMAKRIGSTPQQAYSLEVSPTSDFILFTLIPTASTFYGNYYEPSTISMVNTSSGEQINLVDKMGTNALLSTDGRSIVYVTHLDRDFQIHIDSLP